MSDFKIDKTGASASDQRQLQKLILEINPDALPKYGADGSIGDETNAAIQEILGLDADDTLTVEDATEALQDIVNKKALEVDADKLVTDDAITRDNAKLIQEKIQEILPGSLPRYGADGDIGSETLDALKEILPDVDPAQITVGDLVAKLDEQIEQLPERYIVEDCDNLTQIAREVYADDIKEYTQQLMESGDPKFQDNETAARIHAEQVAVTKIALAPGNEKYKFTEGDNAHTINPGQVIEIPDAGSLKDVDGSLDWEALDAAVGPGGPCGCDGESPIAPSPKEITTTAWTPVVRNSTPAGLPHRVQLSPTCWAELNGSSRGFLGAGEERPRYSIKGEELDGEYGILTRKLQEMGHNVKVRSNGSCDFPNEGGDGTPDPVGGKTDPGLGDGPGPGGTSTLG